MRLDDDRRSHSRRRRGRSRERLISRVNMLFWGAVALLVMGYLGVLAFSVIHKTSKKTPVAAKPAAPAKEVPAAPSATTSNAVQRDALEVSRHIKERIGAWNAAAHDVGEADLLQHNGKFDQAAQKLDFALNADPDLLEAKWELAGILFQKKKYREAEELLIEGLAADPDRQNARMLLANVYASQRLYQAALDVVRWVLDADPYLMEAHVLAAQAYMNLDQLVQSADHWKKVTNAQRENLTAINSLAQVYMRMNRQRDAIDALKKALAIDDKDSSTYYNLAVCCAQVNDVPQVVDVLVKAAGLFGNSFVASWAQGADFEIIRTNMVFMELQGQLAKTGNVEVASTVDTNAAGVDAAAEVKP